MFVVGFCSVRLEVIFANECTGTMNGSRSFAPYAWASILTGIHSAFLEETRTCVVRAGFRSRHLGLDGNGASLYDRGIVENTNSATLWLNRTRIVMRVKKVRHLYLLLQMRHWMEGQVGGLVLLEFPWSSKRKLGSQMTVYGEPTKERASEREGPDCRKGGSGRLS